MIKLNTEKYCENCPEFDAKVIKIGCDGDYIVSTTIVCEHLEKCRRLVLYLKDSIIKSD